LKTRIYAMLTHLRKFIPPGVRALVRNNILLTDYDRYQGGLRNPYAHAEPVCNFPESRYTLGIITEWMQGHKVYIAACREMHVSYKLIDITTSNWVDTIHEANCDAYLVWPSASLSIWKEMFDDRLRILSQDLGQIVFPACHETWLYENKLRVRDWLTAHELPHPRTWIFYDREQALEFVRQAPLPLVFKSNIGASHSGVWILRRRTKALNMVRRVFSRGVVARRHNPLDRQWGMVYFQEYLPGVKEWRMVRIGDSYFGHLKQRRGDFHSGSGLFSWDVPPCTHLDFLKHVTDVGNFHSMDVDMFETQDGRLLVNELHCVFGAGYSVDQLRVDGKPGRFIFDEARNEWLFEAGDFSRNMCANARVDYLINHILPSDGAKLARRVP
jgi:hypothetical protein